MLRLGCTRKILEPLPSLNSHQRENTEHFKTVYQAQETGVVTYWLPQPPGNSLMCQDW